MTDYVAGEIYYADVPFDEGHGSKIRPVLVMDANTICVLSLKMTTHPPRDKHDYQLKDWKESGLKRETTVRLIKYYKLTRNRMLQKIGNIGQYDWSKIIEKLGDAQADGL